MQVSRTTQERRAHLPVREELLQARVALEQPLELGVPLPVRVEPQEPGEVPRVREGQEDPTALLLGMVARDRTRVKEVPARAATRWAPLAVPVAVPVRVR